MADRVVSLPDLHPAQARVVAESARFNVLMCGRRFGKTKLGVERAMNVMLDGQPVGWFAPTNKFLLEPWDELVRRLEPIARVRKQEDRILTVNGGTLETWSFETDGAGRSREYALVIIDEAGLVRDLQRRLHEDIWATIAKHRGVIWFLGTPKGMGSYFSKLFSRPLSESDWRAWRMGTADNPYIPPEEIDTARREMPPEAFEQEYLGIPAPDGGNPFGSQAIRQCIGELSSKEVKCYGVDLARAQDYTVVIGLDEDRRTASFDRFQLPWPLTVDRIAQRVGKVPCLVDSTGVGDGLVPWLDSVKHLNVTGYTFSLPSKQHLMERLVHVIQHGETRYPDGAIVAELESFQFEYRPSGVRYEAPPGMHDDCVMALGLAHLAADRLGVRPYVAPQPETFDPSRSEMKDPEVIRLQKLAEMGAKPFDPTFYEQGGAGQWLGG